MAIKWMNKLVKDNISEMIGTVIGQSHGGKVLIVRVFGEECNTFDALPEELTILPINTAIEQAELLLNQLRLVRSTNPQDIEMYGQESVYAVNIVNGIKKILEKL
jgi:hypothetical protein